MFYRFFTDKPTQIVAWVGTGLSLFGTLSTLFTFYWFKWLYDPPRDLFLCFIWVDLLACVLTAIALVYDSEKCTTNILLVVLFHYCFLAEYLWQAAMCHAVYTRLSAMSMILTDAAGAADVLIARRANEKALHSWYYILAWGLPVVFTTFVFVYYPICHMTDVNRPFFTYAVVDVASFAFNICMWIHNIRKARRCMTLLDLRDNCIAHSMNSSGNMETGPTGTVHRDSINEFKTYVGMFLLFGLSRVATIAISIEYIAGHIKISSFDRWLRVAQAFLLPTQGFVMFIWFCYKFRFVDLWKNEWKQFCARSREKDDDMKNNDIPMMETIAGFF